MTRSRYHDCILVTEVFEIRIPVASGAADGLQGKARQGKARQGKARQGKVLSMRGHFAFLRVINGLVWQNQRLHPKPQPALWDRSSPLCEVGQGEGFALLPFRPPDCPTGPIAG